MILTPTKKTHNSLIQTRFKKITFFNLSIHLSFKRRKFYDNYYYYLFVFCCHWGYFFYFNLRFENFERSTYVVGGAFRELWQLWKRVRDCYKYLYDIIDKFRSLMKRRLLRKDSKYNKIESRFNIYPQLIGQI